MLILGSLLAGTASAASGVDDLILRIEQGYAERDVARIEAARIALLDLSTRSDRSPAEANSAAYFAAYARFRQALTVPSDWATPRLVGGDRELALTKLERATRLFATAVAAGSEAAAWGAAEAWQQLGVRYRELGWLEAAEAASARAEALTAIRLQVAAAGP